jgi:hypothetical protein
MGKEFLTFNIRHCERSEPNRVAEVDSGEKYRRSQYRTQLAPDGSVIHGNGSVN